MFPPPKLPKLQRHSEILIPESSAILSPFKTNLQVACPLISTTTFRNHTPWPLFNFSLSSLGIGHHGPWVPGWDAQNYHTTDKSIPRDRIQESWDHCLVILQLATGQQESLKKCHSQMNWSICSRGDPLVYKTRKVWYNVSDREGFPLYKTLWNSLFELLHLQKVRVPSEVPLNETWLGFHIWS